MKIIKFSTKKSSTASSSAATTREIEKIKEQVEKSAAITDKLTLVENANGDIVVQLESASTP